MWREKVIIIGMDGESREVMGHGKVLKKI